MAEPSADAPLTPQERALRWCAGAVATSALVYELLAGTVASWLLGDSVRCFSAVVGGFLAALGLGAWLSERLHSHLAERFVLLELALALVGGASTPLLFLAHARGWPVALFLLVSVLLTGVLAGLEVPLLLRVASEQRAFVRAVSDVLAWDHLGSLAGSLLFSLVCLPRLGPLRTGLAFALLNTAVALASTVWLAPLLRRPLAWRAASVTLALGLGFALHAGDRWTAALER